MQHACAMDRPSATYCVVCLTGFFQLHASFCFLSTLSPQTGGPPTLSKWDRTVCCEEREKNLPSACTYKSLEKEWRVMPGSCTHSPRLDSLKKAVCRQQAGLFIGILWCFASLVLLLTCPLPCTCLSPTRPRLLGNFSPN